MNKRLFIIIGAFLILGFIGIPALSLLIPSPKPPASLLKTLLTPTPIPLLPFTFPKILPKVIAISPKQGASDVPLDQKITLTFDRNVSFSDFSLTFIPQTSYQISLQDRTVIVSPSFPLMPNTPYTLQVTIDTNTSSFMFKTHSDPELEKNLDTGRAQADAKTKSAYTDVFLKNRTPFENNNFLITSGFSQEPSDHFTFSVYLKGDTNTSKQQFVLWLQSFGLSTQEINSLDIHFLDYANKNASASQETPDQQ